jgi:hypothetical protein
MAPVAGTAIHPDLVVKSSENAILEFFTDQ